MDNHINKIRIYLSLVTEIGQMGFPQQVISQLSTENTKFLTYPSDISSVPHVCVLRFSKYQREVSVAPATYATTGTVVLPLPNQLAESQSIDHSDKQFPILGLIAAVSQNRQNGSLDQLLRDPAFLGAGLSTLGGFFAQRGQGDSITALLGRGLAGAGDLLQSTTGTLINPHATVLFSGVPLREFTYNWSFSPRNATESRDLQKIITFMKQKSLPRLKNSGVSLEYPEEVQLDFLGGGIEGYVFGTKRTVITNLSLDHAPEGTPAFYKSGAPIRINLNITLKEVAIRTADELDDYLKD